MGLEGLVSKRRDCFYRGGRFDCCRRSKVSSERLINYLSTEPVMPELTP